MPVFFIRPDQIRDGCILLTGQLLQHVRDSLRVRPGEELQLGLDRGARYRVKVTAVQARELTGVILERLELPTRRTPMLTLGTALLKGDRMDWLIQKATELGVARIVPLITTRGIVRPREERVDNRQARWRRIALEAAQQSERWDIPDVEAPRSLDEFLEAQPAATMGMILAEREHAQPLIAVSLPSGPDAHLALAIGPEGGWTEAERAAATVRGFVPVTLGERILRAETAALASVSVLQSRLGELGREEDER